MKLEASGSGAHKKDTSVNSWFSWAGSKHKDKFVGIDSHDEDQSLTRIQKELEESIQKDATTQGEIFLVRILLKSGKLDLDFVSSSSGDSLAHASLQCSYSMEVYSSRLRGEFCVDSITIADLCTSRPIIPYILIPKVTSAKLHPFLVVFKTNEGSTKDRTEVDIKASSLRICLNEPCAIALLDFFIPKIFLDATGLYLQEKLDILIAPSYVHRSAMYGTGSLLLTLDIDAPIIIVPIDSSLDRGCLFLDMGHLVLTADVGSSDFELKSKLYDVYLSVPPVVDYNRVDNSTDLLEPFSLSLVTGSRHPEVAKTTISLKLLPGINCIVDSARFTQVLQITNVIMRVIESLQTTAPEPGGSINTPPVKTNDFSKMESKVAVVIQFIVITL